MTDRDNVHKRGARGPRVSPPTPWAEHLRSLDPSIVLYDGLDDGLIGGMKHANGRYCAVYSRKRCLETLRRQGMSLDEAVFHLDTILPTDDEYPPLMVLDTY